MTRDPGPIGSSFPVGFSGIDPSKMDQLISQCRKAESALAEVPSGIRRMFNSFPEVNTMPLLKIVQIGHWMDGQIPLLHRRRQLILASDGGNGPKTGLLPYAESEFTSPAEAQKYGRALAERLKKIKHSENYDAVLKELAANKYDPDVTAAFFAALGAERARKLPIQLPPSKSRLANDVSDAFGTAVSAGGHVPGFSQVSQQITTGDLDSDDLSGLAKLLGHGEFPPDWLANVIRTQAIDPVLNPIGTGVSTTDRSLRDFLHALTNNPAAARLAIGGNYATPPQIPLLSDLPPTSVMHPGSPALTYEQMLAQRIKALVHAVPYDPTQPEGARELGRAFAAASGADDESDGNHSVEASWFAYSIMKNLGSMPNPLDPAKQGVPQSMKIYMSRIAGSYATEVTEGAGLNDKNSDDSSAFGKTYSVIPGLNPVFSLSPKDTYKFLRLFADSDDLEKPFDEGMGRLSARLKRLGVEIESKRKPGDDSPGMNEIMQALGDVAGVQLASEKEIRGKLDEDDGRSRKVLQKIISAENAAFGFAAPEAIAGELIWEVALYGGDNSVGDALDSVGTPRTDALEKERMAITLANHYDLVNDYITGGYEMQVSPADFSASHYPPIVDAAGRLIPFRELQRDQEKMKAFRDWLRANGMGGSHERAFGESSLAASSQFLGSRQNAIDYYGSLPK